MNLTPMQSQDQEPQIPLTLSISELNTVLGALTELPWKLANPIIASLHMQHAEFQRMQVKQAEAARAAASIAAGQAVATAPLPVVQEPSTMPALPVPGYATAEPDTQPAECDPAPAACDPT